MSAEQTILIGDRIVGAGYPAYVVAEIGINHNGDMDLARNTIDAAVRAGADAVKFQNYLVNDFVVDGSLDITYLNDGLEVTEPQRELFERCELTDDQVRMLAAYCAEVGIDFHSTPTNASGVALLSELNVYVMKNGSDFLSHLPLVADMARSGIPTVLSTGMATVADIDEAVRAFRDAGGKDLLLLHCVSQYPTPPAELNLRRIGVLANLFGVPVGFSDHSEGTLASCLSLTEGACWIEKHFTLDRALPGPDHRFSSDEAEMRDLVDGIRAAEQMMGNGEVGHRTERESGSGQAYRLSCAAARDLKGGHVLKNEDIAFFRPGSGFPPAMAELFVGQTLTNSVTRGTVLDLAMVR